MFRVYAENTQDPIYLTRKELEDFCADVIVENFPRNEWENIRYFLPQYTLSQNVRHSAVRILKGLGFRVANDK